MLKRRRHKQPTRQRPRRPVETEAGFQQAIIDLARHAGWIYYHTFDSRGSVEGFPDLVLVRPPSVIFAEVKTAKGHVRAEQWDWFRVLDRCPGVEAYIWRPEHWPGIEKRLRRNDR